jgi:hypothetical protein
MRSNPPIACTAVTSSARRPFWYRLADRLFQTLHTFALLGRTPSRSSSSAMRCSRCSSFCDLSHFICAGPHVSFPIRPSLSTNDEICWRLPCRPSSLPDGRATNRAWPHAARRAPRPQSIRRRATTWRGSLHHAGSSSRDRPPSLRAVASVVGNPRDSAPHPHDRLRQLPLNYAISTYRSR